MRCLHCRRTLTWSPVQGWVTWDDLHGHETPCYASLGHYLDPDTFPGGFNAHITWIAQGRPQMETT